jgi:hypothetical protein
MLSAFQSEKSDMSAHGCRVTRMRYPCRHLRQIPSEYTYNRLVTTFTDLQRRYKDWCERQRQYEQDAVQLVYTLAAGVLSYIDAPKTFDVKDVSGTKTKPYAEPIKVAIDENGKINYYAPVGPMDVLTRSKKDGYWISGIKLLLDQATNAFPKGAFNFQIHFILREKDGEVQIVGKTFNIRRDDPESLVPIYIAMVSYLEKVLTQPPWEKLPSTKNNIGFELPAVEEV